MNLGTLLPTTWVWPAVGVVGLSLLGFGLVQTERLHKTQTTFAEAKAAWSDERAKAADAARQAEFEARLQENRLASKVVDEQEKYTALQTEHERMRAKSDLVFADNGKLRNDIAAYASGGQTAPDTCTAERGRAATLGGLLAEALRADGESAVDAEVNADGVRALLRAWPR